MSLELAMAAQEREKSFPKSEFASMDTGDHEDPIPDLDATLERLERQLIVRALRRTKGNQSKAAKALGITDRIMGLRVRKYALNPKDFRTDPDDSLQWL